MRRLVPIALAVVLAGCGGSKKAEQSATTANGCRSVDAPPAKDNGGQKPPARPLDPKTTYLLTVQTNCGTFSIALDQKLAPRTTASLVSLTRAGFFDHTVFHRIVPGFVIQGGDPTGSGTGGPGYSTHDKPPKNARYTRGVVAMAKTQSEPPGTAGSQFYVVTGADIGLPPEYAIVGEVAKGLGVVDRIGKLGDASEQPTQTVEIEKVYLGVAP